MIYDDAPERLDRARTLLFSGRLYVRLSDALDALRIPSARRKANALILPGEKRLVNEKGRHCYEYMRSIYVSGEALCRIAEQLAPCPAADVRAWTARCKAEAKRSFEMQSGSKV